MEKSKNDQLSRIESLLHKTVIQGQRSKDFIWAKITGAPSLYRSQITANLFLGGQFSKRGLYRLKQWGVTAVVSMRSSQPKFFYRAPWLKVIHLPTPDRHPPSMSNLKRGVRFIDTEIKKGGKVYVHCFWGEGRGPTMAIAYLISTGMTLEDALTEVKKVRTFINPTRSQFEQLRVFEQSLKKIKSL